jgi:hypothetical protein
MFSHIIIFGSSLPELLGGHSLCAIICGRVLMSHTHRCHSPLLITMTEFPRRSKATCPPAESKDGGSGSADAVWCGVVWCGVVWCGVVLPVHCGHSPVLFVFGKWNLVRKRTLADRSRKVELCVLMRWLLAAYFETMRVATGSRRGE